MERWEPPVAPDSQSGRRARRSSRRARRDAAWPEALELVAARVAIALLFLVPATMPVPGAVLPVGGAMVVVALLLLGAVVARFGLPISRRVWLADGLTLGLLTPVLVVNAFAGNGDGMLQPAESSVYLQTALVSVAILVGLGVYGAVTSDRSGRVWAVTMLPAALSVTGVAIASHDFRTATIVTALTLAWLAAALGTLAAWLAPAALGRYVPLGVFLIFALVAMLAEPRLTTLGGRPAPVSTVQPLLFLLAALGLLLPPVVAQARAPRRSPRRSGRSLAHGNARANGRHDRAVRRATGDDGAAEPLEPARRRRRR